MPRPKRNPENHIEDLFFDLPVDRDEYILKTLERLHRLKLRQVQPPNGSEKAGAFASTVGLSGGKD